MRSRQPGIPFTGTPSCSSSSGSVRGGGGSNGRGSSSLNMIRTRTPRAWASRIARRAQPGDQPLRDRLRALPALHERDDVDRRHAR
jgi:hypothetical protein